jgi:hypothetical protein
MYQQTIAELRGDLRYEDKIKKYQENSNSKINVLKELRH